MGLSTTTEDLVTDVRRRCNLPTESDQPDQDYTDLVLCTMMTDVMRSDFVPSIVSLYESYYHTTEDVSPSGTEHPIPIRATGRAIIDCYRLRANGDTGEMTYVTPSEYFTRFRTINGSNPRIYTILHNKIVFPTDFGSEQLRILYERRPSKLVRVIDCMLVTDDSGAPAYTVSSAFANGSYTVDMISPNDGSVHLLRTSCTVSSGTTATFASSPADAAIGDFIALQGESCVAELPAEFLPLLADATAVSVLKERGHKALANEMKEDLTSKFENVLDQLRPRTKADEPVLHNPYGLGGNIVRRWWDQEA